MKGQKRMRIDLTGQTFERLTVVEYSHTDSYGRACWTCECSCGGSRTTRGESLRSGATVSCGCLQRERTSKHSLKHGATVPGNVHYLYDTWKGMRSRCNTPNSTGYDNYGGRGISVCPEWGDFEVFLADMGDRPEGMSIDRIDNDGNYEPDNCRWATPEQQRSNQRSA